MRVRAFVHQVQTGPKSALLSKVGRKFKYRVDLSLECSVSYLMALTGLNRACGEYGRGEGCCAMSTTSERERGNTAGTAELQALAELAGLGRK